MNCTQYSATVNSGCARYMFAPDFTDWALGTDSCGAPAYMIGFGNTATGPVPTATDCQVFIMHPLFSDMAQVRDNCGNAVVMVGFGDVVAPSNIAALVAAIIADPVAFCALVTALPLVHPSNSLIAAFNAAGDCGLAEGDGVLDWTV